MSKLLDIQSQIDKLQREAAAIRQQELAGAIARVKELCAAYGLTAQMIGLTGKKGGVRTGKSAAPAAAGEPKYREPKSGKTWTGKGKPPSWIAGARNRDKFLIDKPATEAVAPSKSVAPVKEVKAAKAQAKSAKAAASVKRTPTKPVAKPVVKKAEAKKVVAAKPAASKAAAPKVATPKASAGKAAAPKTAPKKVVPAKPAASAIEGTANEGASAQQTEA